MAPVAAFMETERRTLEALLPGLDSELKDYELAELESPGSPGIEAFRRAGGPCLIIPVESDGRGVTAVEMVRTLRAVGARSPSLAIAVTMHFFSVAALLQLARESERGLEWMLLQAIASNQLLVASGFAEGKSGQGVFSPTMRARPQGSRWLVSGAKKPCSLSRSMDLLTASCAVEDEDGRVKGFAVAIVASELPGISVAPFWSAPVLGGAESDSIVLDDVSLENDLLVQLGDTSDTTALDSVQTVGMLWFELLMSASYLGMASALCERVLAEAKSDATSKVTAAYELEAAMASLEGVATELERGGDVERLLVRALLCRYATQDAITRATASCVEQLGGMAFIGGSDVSYFAAASRALAFHPPSRLRTSEPLLRALQGEELVLE